MGSFRRGQFIAAAAWLALLIGCNERAEKQPEPGKPPVAKAPAIQPAIAEDRSFTLEAYVKKGVPAPDRPWVPTDYVAAATVLQDIAKVDATNLPRAKSKASGKLFDRLVARENLVILETDTLPVGQRAMMGADFLQGLKQLLLVYQSASTPAGTFDSELVDISIFGIEELRICFNLADEFMKTLPADDPKRSVREAGVRKMKIGLSYMILGTLMYFDPDQRQHFRTSELIRLAHHLKGSLPHLQKRLPDLTQQELPVRMKKLADQEVDPHLKKALQEVSASLAG